MKVSVYLLFMVSLTDEKILGHSHKTGSSWYLSRVLFKMSNGHCCPFYMGISLRKQCSNLWLVIQNDEKKNVKIAWNKEACYLSIIAWQQQHTVTKSTQSNNREGKSLMSK